MEFGKLEMTEGCKHIMSEKDLKKGQITLPKTMAQTPVSQNGFGRRSGNKVSVKREDIRHGHVKKIMMYRILLQS